MRFLVDACLSPRLAQLLVADGHDAVHVVTYGIAEAAGTILAATRATEPSVVLFRLDNDRRVDELAGLIAANSTTLASAIDSGSIVVITDKLVRVRSLPIL